MIGIVLQASILAGSLVLLASSGHFAIKSIEELIELTGLSEAAAGFAILAVMTSTPEITVAVFSIIQGAPGISVGDILGSNIFNLGAVLGILGTLGYMKTCSTDLLVELTDVLFVTSLIPLLLVISQYHIINVSSPIVGAGLLGTFVATTYIMSRKKTPRIDVDAKESVRKMGLKTIVAKLLLSFAGVIVASRLVVISGMNIALAFGVPPILIGAKLVSIGTSLPELTLDFTAVRKGRVQLAIGDIVGSNLTNLTLVLGLVLIASPFAVNMTIFTELLPFLLVTTIIFLRFLARGGLSQVGGIILIMTYILFQAIIV